MIRYTGTTIGKIVIKQKMGNLPEKRFTLQIRTGNCLAVILHVTKITEGDDKGKYLHTLYSFYADEQHMKNMLKNDGKVIYDDVVSIELNMFYKENYKLLKYFVQSGYKVKCYYKPSKN